MCWFHHYSVFLNQAAHINIQKNPSWEAHPQPLRLSLFLISDCINSFWVPNHLLLSPYMFYSAPRPRQRLSGNNRPKIFYTSSKIAEIKWCVISPWIHQAHSHTHSKTWNLQGACNPSKRWNYTQPCRTFISIIYCGRLTTHAPAHTDTNRIPNMPESRSRHFVAKTVAWHLWQCPSFFTSRIAGFNLVLSPFQM